MSAEDKYRAALAHLRAVRRCSWAGPGMHARAVKRYQEALAGLALAWNRRKGAIAP